MRHRTPIAAPRRLYGPARRAAVASFAAALLLAGPPDALRAQTSPKTYSACYVPATGTIYRIQEEGLRTSCAASSHVAFTWTDGAGGGTSDHGALSGLGDDDHPQYLLVDAATRALLQDLDANGHKVGGLAAATQPGDAVRFEQAVKVGDAAGGDLAGTFPSATVQGIRGRTVSTAPPTDGDVLVWRAGLSQWEPDAPAYVGAPAGAYAIVAAAYFDAGGKPVGSTYGGLTAQPLGSPGDFLLGFSGYRVGIPYVVKGTPVAASGISTFQVVGFLNVGIVVRIVDSGGKYVADGFQVEIARIGN